jgi:hypothetical protein
VDNAVLDCAVQWVRQTLADEHTAVMTLMAERTAALHSLAELMYAPLPKTRPDAILTASVQGHRDTVASELVAVPIHHGDDQPSDRPDGDAGGDDTALHARRQPYSFQHARLEARRDVVALQAERLRLERGPLWVLAGAVPPRTSLIIRSLETECTELGAIAQRLTSDETTLARLLAEIETTRTTIASRPTSWGACADTGW